MRLYVPASPRCVARDVKRGRIAKTNWKKVVHVRIRSDKEPGKKAAAKVREINF